MSNLVIKIKHNTDLSSNLEKAFKIANFGINNRSKLSSANVKDIGLPSAISNQILRKYGRNKKCKHINPEKIKLVAPSQSIKIIDNTITITPLKLTITNQSKYKITKVNQIEIDHTYAYVCFNIEDKPKQDVQNYIGVDLNATSHCAVVGNPKTGKILKLGRQAPAIHKKYKALRSKLQSKKLYKKLKQTKGRESRIVRDINHKISKKIVEYAKENNSGIKLEDLTNIRKNKKNSKTFRYTLNSWSYYQLGQMICYKAQLQGIPVAYISPEFTSKNCSRCGIEGNRKGKEFKCVCGHIDHADVNASFNIALRKPLIKTIKTEINGYGGTDTPIRQSRSKKLATGTLEPPKL
jgi:putative transposase